MPTGTRSLQMYFTALGPLMRECGTVMYTARALSFFDESRSSAPCGNSRGRQDQASTGYFVRSHSYSRPAWIPSPLDTARRKRRPASSCTV